MTFAFGYKYTNLLNFYNRSFQHNCKKAFPFEMDVTSRDQVMATRQKIFETVGAVDILINNAGIMTPQPILTAKPDDIVAVINVNLLAHFWV